MNYEGFRTCHFCGEHVAVGEWCAPCVAAWPRRPAAGEMTGDQREAEFRSLQWAEVPLDLIHRRLEQLLGRPVWTHEIGLNWEGLCREARWEGRPATMEESVDLILEEKRIIVVAEENDG